MKSTLILVKGNVENEVTNSHACNGDGTLVNYKKWKVNLDANQSEGLF